MLLEDILLLILAGSGVFFIGIPFYKLLRRIVPEKRNPVKEAQERLEQARLELEAARLNKEIEKTYETMYDESLNENDTENSNRRKL